MKMYTRVMGIKLNFGDWTEEKKKKKKQQALKGTAKLEIGRKNS